MRNAASAHPHRDRLEAYGLGKTPPGKGAGRTAPELQGGDPEAAGLPDFNMHWPAPVLARVAAARPLAATWYIRVPCGPGQPGPAAEKLPARRFGGCSSARRGR